MQQEPLHGANGLQAPAWNARRQELSGSVVYWSFLEELSAALRVDLRFADEAATAVLCLLEQQIHLRAAKERDPLPPVLGELVVGCGGLQPTAHQLDPDDFIFSVADALCVAEERAHVLVRGVFAAVRSRLTVDEIESIAERLPKRLRFLWKS